MTRQDASENPKRGTKPVASKSLSLSTRCKRWFVRRWWHLMTTDELKREYEWRWTVDQFNKAYGDLSEAMINNYYQGIGTIGGAYTVPLDLSFLKQELSQQDAMSRKPSKTSKNATKD